MSLAREISGAQSSARRGSKPSSGSLPVSLAGAAQLTLAAKRNHNRLVAQSSIRILRQINLTTFSDWPGAARCDGDAAVLPEILCESDARKCDMLCKAPLHLSVGRHAGDRKSR